MLQSRPVSILKRRLLSDQVLQSINQTFEDHVARITPYGILEDLFVADFANQILFSLKASDFKASRDQRQAINRWNTFVLGPDYVSESRRLHARSKEEKSQAKHGFDLLSTVHASEHNVCLKPPEPAHRFEVILEPDCFTPEKFGLFRHYQSEIHKDPEASISQASFRRFLCDSPLVEGPEVQRTSEQKFGSFHQCYRLDGRLIAMAVLDILPQSVSAVYFVYHKDFEAYSFGKHSALREISLALEHDIEYYVMGYYIHNCAKMRYKAAFKPQFMLDPEFYAWHPLDEELMSLLDTNKYFSRASSLPKKGELAASSGTGNTLDVSFQYEDVPSAKVDPREATNSGLSLLSFGMPGIPTLHALNEEVDLARILVQIPGRSAQIVPLNALTTWHRDSMDDAESLLGIIVELIACLGASVGQKTIVYLA